VVEESSGQKSQSKNIGANRSPGRWERRRSRSIGGGIVELKIDFGPGYRVDYVQRGSTLILLLSGGDKDSQKDDTRLARRLANEFKE
jgi:putative addiction module killer protein